MTLKSEFDGSVPRGVVIARACRALLAEEPEDDTGVRL